MNGLYSPLLGLCHRNDEPSPETTSHSNILQLPLSREFFLVFDWKTMSRLLVEDNMKKKMRIQFTKKKELVFLLQELIFYQYGFNKNVRCSIISKHRLILRHLCPM